MKRVIVFGILFLLPVGLLAQFAGGSGTADDPYLVATPEHLNNVRNYLTSYFLQIADIDLDVVPYNEGEGWEPIGCQSNPFTGVYDGNNYRLLNMFVDINFGGCSSLFARIRGDGMIRNLGIENASINGLNLVSCIAGEMLDNSTLIDCYSTGGLSAMGQDIGGLVGKCWDGAIVNSYFSGTISSEGENTGGVCGNNNGTITNCYSEGEISAQSSFIGGLVGLNSGTINENCHSTCNVTGLSTVGGLAGGNYGIISRAYSTGNVLGSYARIGGLVGVNANTISNCHSTGDVSGQSYIGGLVGRCNIYNITNSYYNYENVLINGEYGVITLGAINSMQFNSWISNDFCLNIEDYFDVLGEDYLIASAQDLDELLGFCYYGEYGFKLDNNIDMSEKPNFYYPVFKGKMDGQGYAISNLNINLANNYLIGFIGFLTSSGVVSNLVLENVDINARDYAGGIAGCNECGTITNCSISGTVTGNEYIGGIVGMDLFGQVSDCSNSCSLNGTYLVGGLIGYCQESEITNCRNDGIINGGSFIGGLIGDAGESNITDCCNIGIVSGENTIGGLIGVINYNSIVENCYSNSQVSGNGPTGGLASKNYATIKNCYSAGTVTCNESVGGLIAENEGGTILNSYYDYSQVQINGQTSVITYGALSNELYTQWINNGLHLDPDNYFDSDSWGYYISSVEDMESLLAFCYYETYSFKLINDIDLGGMIDFYMPCFAGKFDGCGHRLENYTVNLPEYSKIGLFGEVMEDSEIANLHLENVNISGKDCVGALTGYCSTNLISDCTVTGTINGNVNVGGIAGRNAFDSSVSHCRADVNVIGYRNVGGITGWNYLSDISNCSVAGSINGDSYAGGIAGRYSMNSLVDNPIINSSNFASVTGINHIGGIFGYGDDGILINCYSRGRAEGEERIGGLCGKIDNVDVTNCYSTGEVTGTYHYGGLIGSNNGGSDIVFSYWDMQSSGISNSDGGEGRTTEQMAWPYSANVYLGWDFINTWVRDTDNQNDGYPYLNPDAPSGVNDYETVYNARHTLLRNYPNPFNPTTTIEFSLNKRSIVNLSIYNIKGQLVKTLLNNEQYDTGNHTLVWDGKDCIGSNVASGVYFYKLENGKDVLTRKMILFK